MHIDSLYLELRYTPKNQYA